MTETAELLLSKRNLFKDTESIMMKAIAICFKPFLKPEEAMIYCNLGHTQLNKRCMEFGIFKTPTGYYKREDLDLILSGGPTKYETALKADGRI